LSDKSILRFPEKVIVILLFILILSCNRAGEKTEKETEIAGISPVTRAERFRLEKNDGYTVVTIVNPWQGANEVMQKYYLINRGSVLPESIDSSGVIFVPVKKIICMSTTHIAMISELGEENSIAGISGIDFPYSESLNNNIRNGLVGDVGYEASLNKELIIKIAPDLLMMYGIGSEANSYTGKIEELGIQVIFNADYLETDPLGKAEWIKLFGALYCKESLADSIYNSEAENYNKIKSYISSNTETKPKVLLGLPFRDIWYISPGNSFISKMIDDAGGDYLWRNSVSSVSMPFGIENVYMSALNADYWLNIGTVKSRPEISMIDPRLADLPCFRKGNLYNNNQRITVKGGNDYWESGAVHPHLILKDIASILHPGIFEEHELFFYREIN
jgi:iron complex transport system substrate-binding protein